MSHYYSYDPNLKSKKSEVQYTFKGTLVKLNSDLGVFSKERVDFGTNVLLNSLSDELLDSVQSVLDLGCGYGVIGISLAKKYPNMSVQMVDVNQRCVELTNENIKNNNIKNAKAIESDVYSNVKNNYDMIISNPPIRAGKEVVFKIVSGAINHLNNNGFVIVVIQKKQGAPSLIKKMEEVFGNIEVINKEKGYYILKSERK